MALLTAPNHAMATVHRLKHHYGACGPEMVHYAAMVRGRNDDAGLTVLCERRLENVVRRSGYTRNRWDARRAVVRGHILVNGRKMTHPGYLVRAGDALTVRPRVHIVAMYRRVLAAAVSHADWLRVETAALRVTVTRLPTTADVDLSVDTAGLVDLLTHSVGQPASA
jgi:small subunit ribosomal protein S4